MLACSSSTAIRVLCAGIFSLDHAAMGLTVLAMGNSLGDMAADLAVARSGKPNMAVTACYAGPFFNMCIGTETAGPSVCAAWSALAERRVRLSQALVCRFSSRRETARSLKQTAQIRPTATDPTCSCRRSSFSLPCGSCACPGPGPPPIKCCVSPDALGAPAQHGHLSDDGGRGRLQLPAASEVWVRTDGAVRDLLRSGGGGFEVFARPFRRHMLLALRVLDDASAASGESWEEN